MLWLAQRVMDCEDGHNFYPIPELEDFPLVSLAEAIAWAQSRDPEFGGLNLKMAFRCAKMFAQNRVRDPEEVLMVEEIAAIHLYTQDGPVYRVLNARLRDRDLEKLKPLLSLVKLLLHGLYKLPVTSTDSVFRGVKEDLSGKFCRGQRVMWRSFSSALPVTTLSCPALSPLSCSSSARGS
jgi:hypothetical protein